MIQKGGRPGGSFLRIKVLSLVAGAGAVFVLSCGPHEEITPAIAVQPGAAARAMALLGHGGPNDPAAPQGANRADAGAGEGAMEDDGDASAVDSEYKDGSGGD